MTSIRKIAFKALTAAEFVEINKRSRGAGTGGGQSYIDFQTSEISEQEWGDFFATAGRTRVSPDGWIFDVTSLGTSKSTQRDIELSNRDPKSRSRFALREQKLPDFSRSGNRLYAWRPEETGFPRVPNGATDAAQIPPSLVDGLRIFLILDDSDQVWATWRKGPPPPTVAPPLDEIFSNRAGILELTNEIELDFAAPEWPFAIAASSEGPEWDEDDELDAPEPGISYSVQKIRKRDRAAASSVRKLYAKCQVSGDEFLFLTKAGKPYLEVHHLIPLGKGGADSPRNMIVVSPQIHKMLHYADVSEIELAKIANNKLAISINGQPYTITWHPQHAARVLAQSQP